MVKSPIGHISATYRAQTNQQQVTTFNSLGEVGYGCFIPAFSAPDVGQQQLLGVSWDLCPQLCSGISEARY